MLRHTLALWNISIGKTSCTSSSMSESGSLSDPTTPLDVAIPIQFLPGNNDNLTVQDTENIAVY
jgi:hypothetical protein